MNTSPHDTHTTILTDANKTSVFSLPEPPVSSPGEAPHSISGGRCGTGNRTGLQASVGTGVEDTPGGRQCSGGQGELGRGGETGRGGEGRRDREGGEGRRDREGGGEERQVGERRGGGVILSWGLVNMVSSRNE